MLVAEWPDARVTFCGYCSVYVYNPDFEKYCEKGGYPCAEKVYEATPIDITDEIKITFRKYGLAV
jgi:hypothetical protein